MLRKLFISLLILSALTSEGTVNLAEYVFSPHLYTDVGLDLLMIDNEPSTSQVDAFKKGQDAKDNPTLLSDTVFIKYSTLLDDTHNLKSWVVPGSYKYDTDNCSHHSLGCDGYSLFSSRNKDIVLYKSDTSPPDSNPLNFINHVS